MKFEIEIKKGCEGFWSCISPDSIFNSLITLMGIFITATITYFITRRQSIQESKFNFQEFYNTIDSLNFWIKQLSDRLTKISNIKDFKDIEELEYHLSILELNTKEIFTNLNINSAPHSLKKILLEIQSCASQSCGYLRKLVENKDDDNLKRIDSAISKSFFKKLNKKVNKNIKSMKKYL